MEGAVFFPETFLSASNAINVAARAPTILAVNDSSWLENIPAPYTTQLYKTATTQPGLFTMSVWVDSVNLVPRLNVYPTSGKSQDLIASDDSFIIAQITYPVVGDADTYYTVSDRNFRGGPSYLYGYHIFNSLQVADVAAAEQTGDHSTVTTAQNLDMCAGWNNKLCVITGNIGSERQRDVYQLPPFTATSWVSTYVSATSDVHVWLAVKGFGDSLYALGPDLSPKWPSHLSFMNSPGPASDQPYFLVVEGRSGGMTPIGAYTLAVQFHGTI